jgi:hypothetical protein
MRVQLISSIITSSFAGTIQECRNRLPSGSVPLVVPGLRGRRHHDLLPSSERSDKNGSRITPLVSGELEKLFIRVSLLAHRSIKALRKIPGFRLSIRDERRAMAVSANSASYLRERADSVHSAAGPATHICQRPLQLRIRIKPSLTDLHAWR